MRKIQVLFPEPMLRQLKQISSQEDRPVSELIRRATEAWLLRLPGGEAGRARPRVPVFPGGRVLLSAESMKAAIYARDPEQDYPPTQDRDPRPSEG